MLQWGRSNAERMTFLAHRRPYWHHTLQWGRSNAERMTDRRPDREAGRFPASMGPLQCRADDTAGGRPVDASPLRLQWGRSNAERMTPLLTIHAVITERLQWGRSNAERMTTAMVSPPLFL